MSDRVGADAAEHAHSAAARGDWQNAFDILMEIDATGTIDSADLQLLGEVAYAAGHLDITIAAWERAYAVSVAADKPVAAAGAAARVAMHLLFDTALMAPVRGWLARADRLLFGQEETSANAWCAVVRTYERLLSGDPDGARPWALRAVDLGSKFDPAAGAIGHVATARILILQGQVAQGLALLQEVGVSMMSVELDALSTGVVYCELVCALQGLAQYDLAQEWTEAMEQWCRTNAIGSIHGRCRVHRAELLRLRGRYDEAKAEAIAACDELRPYLRRELGWPLTELGQIRFRGGNLVGAEQALVAAQNAGWDAQPTRALVCLAEGDIATAVRTIRDALERPSHVPSKERPPNSILQRAPLLEAQVEIEIAANEIDRARAAATELDIIAHRFQSRALIAAATHSRGCVRLVMGDSFNAEQEFTEAARLWKEIDAPYEEAITREDLARAHRAAGSEHEAVAELRVAREILDRIRGPSTRHRAPDDPARNTADSNSLFLREGDHWSVTFDGKTVRVRDIKGMRYLARLLAEPSREFHVLDLVALEGGTSVREVSTIARGDAGPMLDDQARTAYRRRLSEIDDDIADARANGDAGREAQADGERDFLLRELSRAFGLGGAQRRAGAASERARVAVTHALRSALARIDAIHGALGNHLKRTVHTGTYCSYLPDPRVPGGWNPP